MQQKTVPQNTINMHLPLVCQLDMQLGTAQDLSSSISETEKKQKSMVLGAWSMKKASDIMVSVLFIFLI